MEKAILYSLGDENSRRAQEMLEKANMPFKTEAHLFSDTDKPVVYYQGDRYVGLPDIAVLAQTFAP